MENASKALLMAAGVLIGIIILSIAVYLFFNFVSTSRQIHKEIEQNQINQFNAQFTQYEGNDNITFYDIISVTNLAKDNNEYKELTQDSSGNDYITVVLNNNHGISYNNLEKQANSQINTLLNNDISLLQDGELPKYSCRVEISEITVKVKRIIFTAK